MQRWVNAAKGKGIDKGLDEKFEFEFEFGAGVGVRRSIVFQERHNPAPHQRIRN